MRQTLVRRIREASIGSACFLVLATQASAVDREWNQVTGVQIFNNAANWTPNATPLAGDNLTFGLDGDVDIFLGAPSVGNNITFTDGIVEFMDVGGTTLNSGGVVTIDDVFAAGLGDGALVTLSGATWTNLGDVHVADAGFGSLTLNGGGNLTGRQILVGNAPGAEGEVTLTGDGTTLTASLNSNTGVHNIGNSGGTGTINVFAGADLRTTSTSANDIWVGNGADSTGTLNVDGAGSFAETEDLNVGIFGGTGFLNITGGGQVINTDGGANGSPDTAFGANDAASQGMGVVDGDGSLLRSRTIFVGGDGTGRLEVKSGGQARTLTQGASLGDMEIGLNAGSDGKVAVFGGGVAPSLLDVDNSLYVGDAGLGVLYVGQDLDGNANGTGALQVDVDLRIGDDTTNTNANKVVVDGAGATANVDNVTYVGLSGTGTLEVTGGAQFTGRFLRVGQNAGSHGTLLVDGTNSLLDTDADTPDTTDDTVIGTSGTGSATISNGGRLRTDQLWVGYQGNGNGTLTIDNATVNAGVDNETTGSDLTIGGRSDVTNAGGTGSVMVKNGGILTSAVQTVIGGNGTGSGSLTVTGPGSLFDNFDNAPGGASNDILRIGQDGAGTASVLDGGRIEAEGILIGHSSTNSSLAADLTVSGTHDGTPSTVETGGYLYVGNTRKGTMTVEQGAQVKVATSIATERIFIGDDNTADGSKLTISDPGSRVDYFGTGDVSVGDAGGSTTNRAVMEVLNGGVFSAVQRNPDTTIASQARIIIGDLTNGNGQVTVDGAGSRVEASAMYVGDGDSSSSGVLDIRNGGVATTTGEFQAGSNGNGVGDVFVDGVGSTLEVGGDFSLGDDIPGNGAATGNLDVSNGGVVTNATQAFIGHYTGSFGTATLGSTTANTSTWTIGGELTLAGTETSSQTSGSGALNVNTGGRVSVASNLRIRNLGDVNLNGGEITVGDQLLLVDAGSTFNFTSGTLRFTNAAGYTLSGAQLDGIIGMDHTLGVNQHLAVSGTAVLSAPLRLNGGAFSVGAITAANLANLDFDAGTFNLTNANLTVGVGGIFGPTLVVDDPQAIHVTNQATIDAGAKLIVAGKFSSGELTNNGDLTAVDATIGGPVVNNNSVTVVGSVDFDGLVSGPGDFFGPGTANFNGGVAPGASPADVQFEGNIALAAANTLFIEIGGLTPGSQYDRLVVDGNALIDGILDVSLIDNFAPTPGQQFTILSAGSIVNNGLALGGSAAGSFSLLVGSSSVILQAVAGIQGDYNQDGTVNAADYTVWRNKLGSLASLPNDDTPGVGPDDYDRWKTHFGESSGSGSSIGSSATVPEPSSLAMIAFAVFCVAGRRRPLAT
jgi:T5SS/PEP-CTERM-associated repeat protein